MANVGWRMTKGRLLEMRNRGFVICSPLQLPTEARRAETTVAVGGAQQKPRIVRQTEAPRMRRDYHGKNCTTACTNIW
jgi:hypothetical protein